MITINQMEKEIIAAQYPSVHIARTMKQKSGRHRYYMVEDNRAMRILRGLRGQGLKAANRI